jgi:serine/threonine-protein kinase
VVQLILIIALMMVAYHVLLLIWERTAPAEVAVPEIMGMTEAEAVKLLESAGLRVEQAPAKHSDETPEGRVVLAEPPPKRMVKVGRLVRITLSAGSRWATVVDVREMSRDRALALLREAGLSMGREQARYHPTVPLGYVLEQDPAKGEKVRRGSSVNLTISKGPAPPVEVVEDPARGVGVRSADIDLVIPPGASLQEVQVVVRDDDGQRTAYVGNHGPGERITQTVTGRGSTIRIQVFLSGLLIQERTI